MKPTTKKETSPLLAEKREHLSPEKNHQREEVTETVIEPERESFVEQGSVVPEVTTNKESRRLKKNSHLFSEKSVRVVGHPLTEGELEKLAQSAFRYSYHQFKQGLARNELSLDHGYDSESDSHSDDSPEDEEYYRAYLF